MAFVKPIREKGIVVSKKYNEPKAERKDLQGNIYPAKEEEFEVEVISCDEDDFSKDTGIPNGTRATYKVTREIFNKVKFGDWVNVKFTASQFGEKQITIKPESLTLIEK
jgi:hypothetical protein